MLRPTLLLFFGLFSHVALGLETDQYSSLGVSLKDASEEINTYFNQNIAKVLSSPKMAKKSCEQTASLIMQSFRLVVVHAPDIWIVRNPLIEKYPRFPEVSEREYFEQGIYRRVIKLGILPLGRTVNVGDVYLGTDKFGHFVSLGHKYYKHYLKWREEGLSDQEAKEKLTDYGVRTEKNEFGMLVSGVYSSADLEANFQGLNFALGLCHGARPQLVKEEGKWQLSRPFDMRDFVSPLWDESFHENMYTKGVWKKVAPELAVFCQDDKARSLSQRRENYSERVASSPYLKKRLAFYQALKEKLFPGIDHSLNTLCKEEEQRGQ